MSRTLRPPALLCAISWAVGIAAVSFASAPSLTARALAPYEVTSEHDFPKLGSSGTDCKSTQTPDHPCTLRAAIETVDTAAPGDAIGVPGSFVITLDPTLGNLTVSASTSITSLGPGSATVDGALGTRIFHVTSAAGNVIISGLTVRHATPAATDPHGDFGGGILNEGTLTLNNVVVASNSAQNGGGVGNLGRLNMNGGQVIDNAATRTPGAGGGVGSDSNTFLTVTGTRFSDNRSSFGGAIGTLGTTTLTSVTIAHNSTSQGGGGLAAGINTGRFTAPEVTITDSTIADNATAGTGGGIFLGDGHLAMTGSTISGNQATSGSGGGLFVTNSSATMTNDTISNNRAGQGGGGIAQDSFVVPRDAQPHASERTASASRLAERLRPRVIPSTAPPPPAGSSGRQDDITLGWVTLAANSSVNGGGILNGAGFAFTAHDTIVATNSAVSGANCAGTVSSGGHNLESARECGFGGAGDVSDANPLLAGLASYGGPTQTMALQSGSPAIDAGDPACPPPATDQRGTGRPQGTACDIGAFESTLPSPPSTGRPPVSGIDQ